MTDPVRVPAGLVLTHGAGSDRTHHTLVALEQGLAPLPVTRMDFPYRAAGRRPPDRAPTLVAAVGEEAVALAARLGVATSALLLGGRSMGGRMCSMAVADGLGATGLVLLSYPLHPPGRPERLRTEHFPALDLPCLFVSGTRDPFGTPAEFEAATAVIPGPVTHVWLEGARHDVAGRDDEIVAAVRTWITDRWGGRPPARRRG